MGRLGPMTVEATAAMRAGWDTYRADAPLAIEYAVCAVCMAEPGEPCVGYYYPNGFSQDGVRGTQPTRVHSWRLEQFRDFRAAVVRIFEFLAGVGEFAGVVRAVRVEGRVEGHGCVRKGWLPSGVLATLGSRSERWWTSWGEVLAGCEREDDIAWQEGLTAALMRDAGIGETFARRVWPGTPVRQTVMTRLARAPFEWLMLPFELAAATADEFERVRMSREGSLWGVGVRLRMGYFTGTVLRAELVPDLDCASRLCEIEDAFPPLVLNQRCDDRRKRVLVRLAVWNLAVSEASLWLARASGDEG